MEKKILFSPVGKTDPIANNYDGAMLFLCRALKPDVVILYITNEYLEYSQKDHRYERAIELLGEKLQHEFQVKIIPRENIQNPHVVGTFYEDFENIFEEIYQEFGEDSYLMVNYSQGTPAMKSALLTICAMSNHKIALKMVPSPNSGRNQNVENLTDYDLADQWECDVDNEYEGEIPEIDETEINRDGQNKDVRRVINVNISSFNKRIQKEVISRQISNYDYQAAYLVAQMIRDTLHEDVLKLLQIAVERTRLNNRSYLRLAAKGSGFEDVIPYREESRLLVYEYALWLRMKQQRSDYLDFVRGISPMLFALCEYTLKNRFQIDIYKYCVERRGVQYISPEKMDETEEGKKIRSWLDSAFYGGFRETFLNGVQMVAIIENAAETEADKKIAEELRELRRVEEDVRNDAAHQIVYIDDSVIEKRTAHGSSKGKTSGEILGIIRDILKRLGMRTDDNGYWNSYDCMNERINQILRV